LSEAWRGYPRVWATNDRSDARSLLAGETAIFLPGPSSRNVVAFLRNLRAALRLVRRERPAVMITTGADIAVPFAWVARLHGARVVYIESLTRIDELSLSGRLVAPIADRLYVQWPDLRNLRPDAIYAGSVLADR
jgi:UDP-N-acetylglucosamine:LPS N-acetylglucosamine transferase